MIWMITIKQINGCNQVLLKFFQTPLQEQIINSSRLNVKNVEWVGGSEIGSGIGEKMAVKAIVKGKEVYLPVPKIWIYQDWVHLCLIKISKQFCP